MVFTDTTCLVVKTVECFQFFELATNKTERLDLVSVYKVRSQLACVGLFAHSVTT